MLRPVPANTLAVSCFAALASVAVGCAPAPCEHLTDCPGALVCSSEGRCVTSEAPEVLGGNGVVTRIGTGRADPDAALDDFATDAGFAGNIDGVEFADPAPAVEGSSDGYVAWQVTTEVPGGPGLVGMWFDIPVPELLPVGTPRVFTLEEMFADGALPCIQLWRQDGTSAWADDYTMTQYPEDEYGNVLLEIEASNSTSEATANLTIPALM